MAHVSIVKKMSPAEGHCWYADMSIWSENEKRHSQARVVYYLDMLGCEGTSRKEIISVGGYLPHLSWRKVKHIDPPTPSAEQNFVLQGPFDEEGRCGSEACEYRVEYSPEQRIVHIGFEGLAPGRELFVSPHVNLILGANESGVDWLLSSIYFLGVRGCPE